MVKEKISMDKKNWDKIVAEQERQVNAKLPGYICEHMHIILRKNKTNDNIRQYTKCKLDKKWCDGEKFYYDCYNRRDASGDDDK